MYQKYVNIGFKYENDAKSELIYEKNEMYEIEEPKILTI